MEVDLKGPTLFSSCYFVLNLSLIKKFQCLMKHSPAPSSSKPKKKKKKDTKRTHLLLLDGLDALLGLLVLLDACEGLGDVCGPADLGDRQHELAGPVLDPLVLLQLLVRSAAVAQERAQSVAHLRLDIAQPALHRPIQRNNRLKARKNNKMSHISITKY